MDILEMQRRLRNRMKADPSIRIEMVADDEKGIAWMAMTREGERWRTSCLRMEEEEDVVPSEVVAPIDVEIREAIKRWIGEKYPATRTWKPIGQTVLFGRVQVGKTENIMAMIWIGIHDWQKRCVLILANMVGSYHQVLGKDAMSFNDDLLNEFGEAARPFLLRAHGGRHKTRGAIDPRCFLVVMGNPAQLRRLLHETLEETEEVLLFSDEADVHVKGMNADEDDTLTGPLYRQLESRSSGAVNVTATPFALWNRFDARQQTIPIPEPIEYRGVQQMEWAHVSVEDAAAVRKGNVGIGKRLLEDMVRIQKPRVMAAGRGYMTILINGPSTIGRQDALARAIASCTTHRVYSMNSGGSRLIKEARRNRMVPMPYHCIGSVYDEFEMEALRMPHEFRVYVIVACQTASRAISFRPTSRLIGTGGLNGMIFLPSLTTHMAQKVQFMRPFGKYAPDYPIIRIATTADTERSLRAEIDMNLPILALATREMGISRQQMEGTPILSVGRHDRKTVDDTRLVEASSVMSRDFPSREALLAFLGGAFRIREMTEGHLDIPMFDGMAYTIDPFMRKKIRDHVQAGLPNAYRGEKLQFCWNDSRYQTHHSIKNGQGHEYRSRCIAGHGGFDAPLDHVRVVFWKAEYCQQDAINLEDADTAYLFETTRGGWRFYNSREQRRIGLLAH